jgi:hypothetical protein
MARIPDGELERVKREVSLVRVLPVPMLDAGDPIWRANPPAKYRWVAGVR